MIGNCTTGNSEDNFPADIFTYEQKIHGAIAVHIFIALYGFMIIAFVCNNYFLPSVYHICHDLKLSPDVAGATFMATATCAPELFVNIIGTFLTQSDLGLGTVVGSAVFNTLGVATCAGLAAKKDITLEKWPLLRDGGVYILVIMILALIVADNVVMWYEAAVLLFFYFVYFIIMFTQSKWYATAKKVVRSTNNSLKSNSSKLNLNVNISEEDYLGFGSYRAYYFYITDKINQEMQQAASRRSSIRPPDSVKTNGTAPPAEITPEVQQVSDPVLELEDEISHVCYMPGGLVKNLWWAFTLPCLTLLWYTIPDCRVNKKVYPLTFFMCIIWIGVSSYLISWMISIFGNTFHISDVVMGITFLAAGGSVPEAASSIINARKNGVGSMSISNALGANTLDILLCLGFPWFIKTLLPATLQGGPIQLESGSNVFNCFCLIASVVALIMIAAINSFTMNHIMGFMSLLAYVCFITIIILTGLGMLFNSVVPAC
uniref:Sodium/potassium/calcium exchanger 5 n=1 Tax=Cacopsylla melanoneura TaxID=428564 RepID=A0A8D9EYG8_9HEMI